MTKLHFAGVAFLLSFAFSAATAQPVASLEWVTVGSDAAHPIGSARRFDLAFGADQLPVLAYLDGVNLNLKKWDGRVWTSLPGLTFEGTGVRMAYNWAGDIVVGLLYRTYIQVYQLNGSRLNQLGSRLPSQPIGFAVTIDARGPVVAWQGRAGFVVVKRWDGASWVQLGPNVNQSRNLSAESPALAVTGDGKLVVAYTSLVTGIAARVWNGISWAALGNGVPPPSQSLSLGGENTGAPVVAYLNPSSPQVSRWNGSTWAPIGQPCVPPPPPVGGRTFGAPSLTVPGSQPQVVCGIHFNPELITGRRMLVARAWSRLFGWEPLGRGTINGQIALADGNNLAYVVRSGPRGRPWVAWTAQGGANHHNIIVSTLKPPSIAPNP